MRARRKHTLLDLLRAFPGAPEVVRRVVSGADEEKLVRDASRHGLAGLVRHELQAAGATLSAGPAEYLRRQAMANAAIAIRVKRLLMETLDALAGEGITPVLLKGVGLAQRLYPEPFLRATSDVDLLLDPADMQRAQQVMARLGLSPKKEADDYYPHAYRHHLSFAGAKGMVELHFRLMSAYGIAWEAKEPLERSELATFEGRSVRYLRAEDELVYLALHAANHLLQRVAWLYDCKLLIRQVHALDWSQVIEVARRSGMPSAMFYALDVSREAAGADVPPDVLRALRPSPLRVATARRLFSPERLLQADLNDNKPVWAISKVVIADDRTRVLRFAVRRLAWAAERSWRSFAWGTP